MAKRRRGQGEGCIFQRKDGRWCAVITTGYENGRRLRKVFYSKTRELAINQLKQVVDSPYDDDKLSASRAGYVYLLGNAELGYYKIGKARIIDRRVSRISPLLPFPIQLIHSIACEDAHFIETLWHDHFADVRTYGEWFKLTLEDVEDFKHVGESIARQKETATA